jgi:ectoine hydroxylase-related dioxygenase (phytanoyl-CoA dioxygenase family)
MNAVSDEQRRHLDTFGYVVLPAFAPADLLAGLRERLAALFAEEGEAAGSEFRQEAGTLRLANLVDKGEVFRRAIAEPAILELVGQVLGGDFKLSSLNARSANPFNGSSQPLHADGGGVADERGAWVCNAVWMIDGFTMENGPIRAVPGSHAWRRLPQEALADPAAPHPDEVLLTGPAGTIAVMNAHTWHGGTANHTAHPRCALHAFYCRRDKPQQQYQKRLLRPETQAALSPQLRHLLALDDPMNDALTAGKEGRSGFLK